MPGAERITQVRMSPSRFCNEPKKQPVASLGSRNIARRDMPTFLYNGHTAAIPTDTGPISANHCRSWIARGKSRLLQPYDDTSKDERELGPKHSAMLSRRQYHVLICTHVAWRMMHSLRSVAAASLGVGFATCILILNAPNHEAALI